MEIKSNISESCVSFFIIKDNKIAISELTRIDELAKDYAELIEREDYKNIFINEFKNVDKVFYFSRLNVPVQLRGCGFGNKLMEATINFCKENNYMLVNTVNPYGDMNLNQLNEFYQKQGMTLLNNDGLLVFSNNFNKNNKVKLKK